LKYTGFALLRFKEEAANCPNHSLAFNFDFAIRKLKSQCSDYVVGAYGGAATFCKQLFERSSPSLRPYIQNDYAHIQKGSAKFSLHIELF